MKQEKFLKAQQEHFDEIHQNNIDAGWWTDPETGNKIEVSVVVILAKLMLVVTELSEAAEGSRKNLMDDKLPQYKMIHVELADAMIRIADLAGAVECPLAEIIAAKRAFNAVRPDHKLENRQGVNGKKA